MATNSPGIAASTLGGSAATATVLDIVSAAAAQQLRQVLNLMVSMYNSTMHDQPSGKETNWRQLRRGGDDAVRKIVPLVFGCVHQKFPFCSRSP